MAYAATSPKQQAHELINRLSTGQASAAVIFINAMLDPVDRAIANAPFEDEEISDEENRAVAAPRLGSRITSPSPTKKSWPSSASPPRTSSAWGARPRSRTASPGAVGMGQKKIAWTDPAKADLRAIDKDTALRILHTLTRYLVSAKAT